MSDPVIKVENLGKLYTIAYERERYTALRDVIALRAKRLGHRALRPFFNPESRIQNPESSREDFWALRDVSFEIEQGGRVGIIGRNGAGKSTLLKLLSRIMEPTTGRITLKGRVASLLEVGTGFHPELTGRENIYLNGAILGMTKQEIKRKFDEIVDFAEIERFLDTPVKRYSSGMYVRLAFAVAAHLEPEILLVDEVLAVGDAQFQKKCLGKMEDVSAHGGKTVLFVSHNMAALLSLCNRGILLNAGHIESHGSALDVVAQYMSSLQDRGNERVWDEVDGAPGDDIVRLRGVRVVSQGACKYTVHIDEDVFVEVEFWSKREDVPISVSLHLIDKMGIGVLATATESSFYRIGLHKAICRFPSNFLNDGRYSVTAILVTHVTTINVFMKEIVGFNVVETPNSRTEYLGGMLGVIRPKLDWQITS